MAELGLAFSILVPVLFYLFLRGYLLGDVRSYGAAFGNLFDPQTYMVLVKALWSQYGLLILIAIIGLTVLHRQNDRRLAASLGFLLIATLTFNITDSKLFIGYSRFNLNTLPMLLIAAVFALRALQHNVSKWLMPLLVFWLITNMLLSPFHIDGSRKSGWGSYNTDTSEYAYPYDQAFAAIMGRDEAVNILMAGLNYGYDYEFYLKRNELSAAVDLDDSGMPSPEELPAFIDETRGKYDYIIYHYMVPAAPAHIAELSDYRSKTFCNMAHCLTLYERTR